MSPMPANSGRLRLLHETEPVTPEQIADHVLGRRPLRVAVPVIPVRA